MKKIYFTILGIIAFSSISFAQFRVDADTFTITMSKSDIYEEISFYIYNDADEMSSDSAVMIERVMSEDCTMESTICDDFLCYGYDDHAISSRVPVNGKMLVKVSFEPGGKTGVCYQNFTVTSSNNAENKVEFVVKGVTDDYSAISSLESIFGMKVYPNPVIAGGNITISNPSNTVITKVLLTSTLGEIVETAVNSNTISTNGLAAGVYAMTVFSNQKAATQMVIIQ
jgi:hypothetical protein